MKSSYTENITKTFQNLDAVREETRGVFHLASSKIEQVLSKTNQK
jgi:hypothetical protein